ncbi:hypothetical protein CcaverHIS002_0212840 [Cutaneotrichosporon cavernicola]|uniref:Aquaporin-like protein n=1 Tax=Cutaneotrichosporon cavernicola TaxID=279322 RepID=A0AA48I5Z7_9TREE|nr:uncharacterized protein CcaverHIS019_0212840 [Cutaneotrichosporon cavernicola]BEI82124.1 hypothetical protein CcaverHIS002_0212840 [Cutaneotrichosporon cavernicola]BEI89922.1 hypothetical protein CcaverHIS019_0212840 [Cutaneotrichosporon cavernicola]BEI97693.1 hypothetical protein CcaverHIS631_0212820 [Cutaneotrichosporon cavernicola]BEJ05470.1 hypothetical protein CcaverHIS641_0212870 [Cutaneotrichosporon cavernicola]
MEHQRGHRAPGDLEVGTADLFLPHEVAHTAPRSAPPDWLLVWEERRPRFLAEMIAEAFGVFLYCWAGMGATAAFIIAAANKEDGFGSLQTVAWSYSFAVAVALIFIAPTSGGHLSPGVTISFAIFKGFPWRKVPHYIIAQIIGAFLGSLMVYAQFAPQFHAITDKMLAAGEDIFSPASPVGAIALFVPENANLGFVLLNDFFCTFILGVAIYCVIDPTNVFITPSGGPLIIALTFFCVIACFAPNGIALNTARDLGARLAMACVYGRGAFPPKYTALACLSNILATQVGAMFQIMWLSDSIRPHSSGAIETHKHVLQVEEGHITRKLTARANAGYCEESGPISRILSTGALSGKTKMGSAPQHIEKVG